MTDQDPTRMAALEAELASLRTEMQDFSYTVSHDLRANLRHILSYAQLVREDAGHLLPQETLGFLDTITDSARHMGVQMDGLMELTRLGTVALQLEPLPLLPLVQDVVGELQLQYPQRQIEWQLPAELPAVLSDASLLRQALHAVRLGLIHPASGEFMEWQIELPADMKALLEAMRYVEPLEQVAFEIEYEEDLEDDFEDDADELADEE